MEEEGAKEAAVVAKEAGVAVEEGKATLADGQAQREILQVVAGRTIRRPSDLRIMTALAVYDSIVKIKNMVVLIQTAKKDMVKKEKNQGLYKKPAPIIREPLWPVKPAVLKDTAEDLYA